MLLEIKVMRLEDLLTLQEKDVEVSYDQVTLNIFGCLTTSIIQVVRMIIS